MIVPQDTQTTYDLGGNVTTATSGSYTYDTNNNLTETKSLSFTAGGEPYPPGRGAWDFTYDRKNRLSYFYNGTMGDDVMHLRYDGLGRVWQRWSAVWDIQESKWDWSEYLLRFVYDGSQMAQKLAYIYTNGEEGSAAFEGVVLDMFYGPTGMMRWKIPGEEECVAYYLDESGRPGAQVMKGTETTAYRFDRDASGDTLWKGEWELSTGMQFGQGYGYVESYGVAVGDPDPESYSDPLVWTGGRHYLPSLGGKLLGSPGGFDGSRRLEGSEFGGGNPYSDKPFNADLDDDNWAEDGGISGAEESDNCNEEDFPYVPPFPYNEDEWYDEVKLGMFLLFCWCYSAARFKATSSQRKKVYNTHTHITENSAKCHFKCECNLNCNNSYWDVDPCPCNSIRIHGFDATYIASYHSCTVTSCGWSLADFDPNDPEMEWTDWWICQNRLITLQGFPECKSFNGQSEIKCYRKPCPPCEDFNDYGGGIGGPRTEDTEPGPDPTLPN